MIDLKDPVLLERVELSIAKSIREWRSTKETAYIALRDIAEYEADK